MIQSDTTSSASRHSKPSTPITIPIVELRPTTPVIETRPTTPVVELRALTPEKVVGIDVKKRTETKCHEGSDGKKLDKIGETLKRQSKRLQALYEIQKSTNDQIKWIQNHLKQQIDNSNNVDLTSKVFMVSNFIF